MRILSASNKTFADELAAFCRTAAASPEMIGAVAAILADVRERDDAAIVYYAAKFDSAKLAPRNFRVKPTELAAAAKRLPAADKKAIRAALESVRAFNRQSLPHDWTGRNPHGAEVGELHHPLRRVGINVPRGQVPLPSTAIMTIALAQIAGVPEIAVFTPCDPSGRVADVLLATFQLCGVSEVYRVGGVYGVAAMAYGTTSIPAVDKIFGPSNAYVCEAMRQVFGTVGVAGLPGPSEVMIVADETARPDFAAADLLAQAEHGSGKEKIYLVGTTQAVIEAIHREIYTQLESLKR
ncbi:MAG TPA: histidinol dehydrogenase, partial [Opitutaceae bacterium]|nr:histidinol dehydrogenase [Opitutaceae bacterium]